MKTRYLDPHGLGAFGARSRSWRDLTEGPRTSASVMGPPRRAQAGPGEARRELGSLLRVEIVVGGGVRKDGQCLVRFFAIFSLSGDGSSFSCNVSATGIKAADGSIEITALSCAKDEGWGRTIDLKR